MQPFVRWYVSVSQITLPSLTEWTSSLNDMITLPIDNNDDEDDDEEVGGADD